MDGPKVGLAELVRRLSGHAGELLWVLGVVGVFGLFLYSAATNWGEGMALVIVLGVFLIIAGGDR